MNNSCSQELLQSALAGNLSAADETSLGRHLESCQSCSAALEQMAGGPQWCREAASLLVADELDATAPRGDKWSEVDFTVEHLQPSDDTSALGRLGGYDILAVIGQGGMGIVLKGYERELKRLVAIKVLAPHLAQSPLARKRFAREAQAAAAVVHPNVLAIHQVQPEGRLPYLVMPLVAGESLAERLAAQGTLELKEILRISMQAAAGLAAAREQGLVHRDVKPANILLEKGVERAVLTDFGLARAADDVTLTRFGVIAGTPQYMSPEQARGEPLDGRSDLFSLGCVIYEMATGISPFKADSTLATMRRLVDDAPQAIEALNPDLPPWFIAIVNRLLEKNADRRFDSAREVSNLLETCLAHLQHPAQVPLPAALLQTSRRLSRWRTKTRSTPLGRRGRWIAAIVVLALVAVGGLFGFMAATEPTDISGEWTGEDWGHVVLKQTAPTEYEGTYTDTVGKEPGKIDLKWSRVERRYNGHWSEGDTRFGDLSIRTAGDEIRGGWTTNRKSVVNPATPALADLTWTRPKNRAAAEAPPSNLRFGPVTVQALIDISVGQFPNGQFRSRSLLRFEQNRILTPRRDIGQDFTDVMAYGNEAGVDLVACGDGGGRGLRILGGLAIQPADWDASPRQVVDAITAMEHGLDGYKQTIPGFQDPREMGYSNLWFTEADRSTFYIKTRSGRIGTLQITKLGDVPVSVAFRYKFVIDDSEASFAPVVDKQLNTVSSKDASGLLRLNNFLRLSDGHLFNLPPDFENISADERNKWLDETKVNFAIDYHKDTDQWEFKLRNVKFVASLRDDQWWSLGANELEERFEKMSWQQPSNPAARLMDNGFLRFAAGMPPPMTFAYETSDGQRGIFQFYMYNHAGTRDEAFVRYKQLRQPDAARSVRTSGDTEQAPASSPPKSSGLRQERSETSSAAALSHCVIQFNKQAGRDPIGKDQPPLTEDEVMAAIRWLLEATKDNGRLSDSVRQRLQAVLEQHTLPNGGRLDVTTQIQGADGEVLKTWMINLILKNANGEERGYQIRQQLLGLADTPKSEVPDGSRSPDQRAAPLAAAIAEFNAAHNTICGMRQAPLTESEVVAAIRWLKSHRDEAPVTNREFADFQKIAETRQLPQGAELEVIAHFEPVTGMSFDIWSVRIRMPRETTPGSSYAYEIRRQYICSEPVNDDHVAWGAAGVSGLQAGVRLDPRQESYAAGQQVTPTFYYRNIGKERLDVAFPNLMTRGYYNKLIALDSAGKDVSIEQTQDPAEPVGWQQLTLSPGAIHAVRGLAIMLGDLPRRDAETVIRVPAGQSVRLRFELPDLASKDAKPLDTGEVGLSIDAITESTDGHPAPRSGLREERNEVKPLPSINAEKALRN